MPAVQPETKTSSQPASSIERAEVRAVKREWLPEAIVALGLGVLSSFYLVSALV